MFTKILVPIDGGDLSNIVIKEACAFAKDIHARLVFYYAKPAYMPEYLSGEVVVGVVGVDVAFLNAMKKQAADILGKAALVATSQGVDFEKFSDEYNAPYEGIIAAAESKGCDLIFMASHGRRGASALLLGSETQKVLTHCKIPVLVYR
jgi:nucleotide-binding universal stress UspA family protein